MTILVSECAPSLLSPSVLSLLPVGAAVLPSPAPPLHPFVFSPLPVCELLPPLGELVLQLCAVIALPSFACNHETSIGNIKQNKKKVGWGEQTTRLLTRDTGTAEQLHGGCTAASFIRCLFCFQQGTEAKPHGTQKLCKAIPILLWLPLIYDLGTFWIRNNIIDFNTSCRKLLSVISFNHLLK